MSAFKILVVLFALVIVSLVGCEKVSFRSKVNPRIFGCLAVGRVCLLRMNMRVVLYTVESGMKRVAVALSVFMCRLLVVAHWSILLRYGYRSWWTLRCLL